jgi:hypothetical protein
MKKLLIFVLSCLAITANAQKLEKIFDKQTNITRIDSEYKVWANDPIVKSALYDPEHYQQKVRFCFARMDTAKIVVLQQYKNEFQFSIWVENLNKWGMIQGKAIVLNKDGIISSYIDAAAAEPEEVRIVDFPNSDNTGPTLLRSDSAAVELQRHVDMLLSFF